MFYRCLKPGMEVSGVLALLWNGTVVWPPASSKAGAGTPSSCSHTVNARRVANAADSLTGNILQQRVRHAVNSG